jgi:hypothetical protein
MGDQNQTRFRCHTTYGDQKKINHHTIGDKMLSVTKLMLRTATHTKTGNNTGSFETRTNNTTTHTKLRITLEASKLESITQQLTQNWE